MTTKAQSVAEEVEAIRERLSVPNTIATAKWELHRAILEMPAAVSGDYEAIELWARLVADLAGMLQRQK